jgi:hypothetical protein
MGRELKHMQKRRHKKDCVPEVVDELQSRVGDNAAGFNLDWILGELVRLGDASSGALFGHYCSSAPQPGGVEVGATTKLFLMSVAGLSHIGSPLPEWHDEDRSPQIAWKTLRNLIYNELAGKNDENDALWMFLESEDPLGGVSVLLQIRYYLEQLEWSCPVKFRPEFAWPDNVKRLMEIGLKNWERIDFGDLSFRFLNPFSILAQILEKVGDEQTVGLLDAFTSDQQKGEDAIRAIREIKQRLRCPDPSSTGSRSSAEDGPKFTRALGSVKPGLPKKRRTAKCGQIMIRRSAANDKTIRKLRRLHQFL